MESEYLKGLKVSTGKLSTLNGKAAKREQNYELPNSEVRAISVNHVALTWAMLLIENHS
ncbi:hypothetical protein EMIT0P265_360002 [Pseudomonas zeae]